MRRSDALIAGPGGAAALLALGPGGLCISLPGEANTALVPTQNSKFGVGGDSAQIGSF